MRLVSLKPGTAIVVCAMAIVFGQTGGAQDLRETQPKPAPAAQAPAPAPSTPAAQPAPRPADMTPPRRAAPPSVPNIRVDITITDQAGAEPPLKKTLTVIAADNGSGAVRSKATVAVPRYPPGPDPKNYLYEDLPLNVDVGPTITENENRIRMKLIVNYETFSSRAEGTPPVRSIVTVDQWVMLDNGKPLVVSQSADATTDRKVTVEVKATIMR